MSNSTPVIEFPTDLELAIELPNDPAADRLDAVGVEIETARCVAERYGFEFIDMDAFRIDQELFRSIPADLMLRYGFVPSRRDRKTLVIVVSDPSNLPMLDELALLL